MTTTTIPTRQLGRTGPTVSALGLGAMAMSGVYGPSDRDESLATLRAAMDSGITLLDTGDFYGMGDNELLLADALRGRDRDSVVLSVKFGALRGPAGEFAGVDARPAAVKNFLAYTLRRLGVDHVDVYRPARVDPAVPVEETAGAVAELIEAGYVRHLGMSEAGSDALRRAHAVTPVADLQVEWSLMTRTVEGSVLDTCRALGIGITAYGVLSRGLLSGHWSAQRAMDAGDFRAHSPRFSAENVQRNLALVEALQQVADEHGAAVAQVATAWVLARGEDVVPLVGARRRDPLAESLGALQVDLSADDLRRVEAAVPAAEVAGTRYDAAQMGQLDSERG